MSFLALVPLAYHDAYALARIQDNIPLYTTILIIYIKPECDRPEKHLGKQLFILHTIVIWQRDNQLTHNSMHLCVVTKLLRNK